MSNLSRMGGQRAPGLPTPPKGEPIARYATYLEAQRAVDFLSDNQFPVQFVTIVGSGLRMVERVTGRLTYPRIAVAGAASGAWFGLFVGVLMSLFGTSFASGGIFAAVAIGAAFGMMFGVISYALTGGRRDFTSTSQIVASEYEVLCMPDHSRAAIELLATLPGGTGAPPAGQRPAPAPWGGAPAGPSTTYPPSYEPQHTPVQPRPGGSSSSELPGRPPPPDLPPPTGTPSPGPGPGEPGGPPAPVVTGPTYGEMIEKKRLAERAERERAEARERERARGDD